MSKIKIYDGVVIDMATSEVISHGDVSYVDSEDVAYTKGGGGTSTSTSGFAEEHKPYVTRMLADAEGLYGSGQLGKVAGFTPTQLAAQKQGITAAGAQTGLEGSLASQAAAPVNLSGMRTAAQTEAQKALGINAANAYGTGNMGGSRQAINSASIANDLASRFAGIDQQAQATKFANTQAALAAQGTGAQTLAGIGSGQQQQAQNEADAAYKAIAQRVGLFTGMADKETTTTQSGGK